MPIEEILRNADEITSVVLLIIAILAIVYGRVHTRATTDILVRTLEYERDHINAVDSKLVELTRAVESLSYSMRELTDLLLLALKEDYQRDADR